MSQTKQHKKQAVEKASNPSKGDVIRIGSPGLPLKGFLMSDNGTFIYLFRKITNTSFYKDSIALHLAIHCLLKAYRFPKDQTIGNQVVSLETGQFVSGRHTLNQETGINESAIYRKLNLLEKAKFLNIKRTTKYSIISIVNYGKYQIKDSERTTDGTASEQQTNTIKKDKKEDKEKKGNDFPHLNNQVFKENWLAWLDVRKKLKVPNTERALKIALNKLQAQPIDVAIKMLDQSIERGYKGIFPLKDTQALYNIESKARLL